VQLEVEAGVQVEGVGVQVQGRREAAAHAATAERGSSASDGG